MSRFSRKSSLSRKSQSKQFINSNLFTNLFRMKKQFFAAAMILALGAGFTACSSDDLNVKEQKEAKSGKTATGYLTYTFSVATPGGTRAATNDGQGDDNATAQPGYNFVERWKGNDEITKVTAYVFNGSDNGAQLEVKDEATNFTFAQESAADGNKTVIKPTKGIKVTVGEKTVYLVVNPTSDVNALLDGINNLGDFKAAYESANLAFANRTTITATATSGTSVNTAADALYTPGTTAGSPSTIVMTGAPVTQTVIQGIEEGAGPEDGTVDADFGTTQKNRFNFTMKRAVATVFVTSKEATSNEYTVLTGDDPTTSARETNNVLATVSDLKFSQAQGELKLYFQQKAAETTDNTAYQTPAYSFIPTSTTYGDAAEKYDYNGLWKETAVSQVNKDKLVADDGEAVVKGATVVPFLPATHQWTTGGDNYKEGNTAYVLVRATLKPKFIYELNAQNELTARAFAEATDKAKFFYGSDNKFYTSKEAVAKAKETNASLKAKMFTNGKGLYTVWINPDTPTGKQWKNSPTNRNNIYHISITGIKSMPENWNPLVPPGVVNPDPKPKTTDNPDEPDPKHKPENPLSPVETWMSVDATILPWSIHSYGVEL